MNLVIDIGNTYAKAALFDGVRMVNNVHCRIGEPDRLQEFADSAEISACAVSCVAAATAGIDAWINMLKCPTLRVTGVTPLPFRNNYRTPLTLGSDRIAAVAGAMALYPHTNVLVADIGTCLTLDVLTADGIYLGGNVSPGPTMRFTALNTGTARLPLVAQEGDSPLIGYSTETAIRSGVMRGLALEVEGFAQKLRETMPGLILLVTGGKSTELLPLIDTSAHLHHEPFLVETGLNNILSYCRSKDSALPAQ